jgi:hypothetical protein
MKKLYTGEQIIKAIKKHEAGAKVEDICRDLVISNGTFYTWRSKFAGLCSNGYYEQNNNEEGQDCAKWL